MRRGHPQWSELNLALTDYAGHARALARAALDAGAELVLAVGGDGTANEVAEPLLGSGVAFGVVPVGSGNGLARTLGIRLDPEAAVEQLATGRVRRIDVGTVNGRPFLNVAGAGFDAAVGAAFHAHGQRGGRRGILSYVRFGLGQLHYAAPAWHLVADAERFDGRALVVAFANGRQYGAGAVIAPRARLDDGRLDVVIFEDMPRWRMLLEATRLFMGGIDRVRGYRALAGARLELTGPAPFEHHRDGEPEPVSDRLEINVLPRALAVVAPRVTVEDPNGPFLA